MFVIQVPACQSTNFVGILCHPILIGTIYLMTVTDGNLSSGKIGVGVVDNNTPIEVQFKNAELWLLTQPCLGAEE
jgi:pantoate kinase